MSGSNALTIARDPTVQVNPLAAMNAGTQAAGNVMDVQAKQGERLVGQALQQATDEQGNVDIGKARSIAAGMGPNAAFAMEGFLKTASTLRGQGIEQNLKINDAVNAAVTAALASDDANLKQAVIEQAGRLRGILPADQVDHALLHLSSDPAQLRRQLETLRVQSLPPQQRQDWIYGTRAQVSTGGSTEFPTVPAPGRGEGPTVLHTLSPAEQNERVTIPDPRPKLPDGSPNPDYGRPKTFTRVEELQMNGFTVLPNGQVIRSGGSGGTGGGSPLGSGRYNVPPALRSNPSPASNPPPASNAPAAPTIQFGNPDQPQAVPAPPGGSTSAAPYTGGGIGTVLAPAAPGPRSDITPPPNANVAAILQGMQNARANPLGGSAMTAGPGAPTAPTVAATPEPGWGTAPGTYDATPAAPVARPAAAPPPAQRSPFDRPAMGFSPAEQEQIKAAGPQFGAEIAAATQAQAQQAVLANMLADTKQFMPGPYAETIKNIRARLAPIFGVNETALAGADSFDKLAAQLSISQGASVGAGSDARFSVVTAANPHPGMSAAGVDLVLRQLQGNADYILARQRLAQDWPAKADYNGFVDSVRQLDPRVFQYERLQPGKQRSDFLDSLDARDQRTFMLAHKWAEGKNLIPSR